MMKPTTVRLEDERKRRAQIIKTYTHKSLSDLLGAAIDKEYRKIEKKFNLK